MTDISRLLLNVVVSRTSQLLVTMFLGFVLTYLFAAIGWKLVIPYFEYGFEGSLIAWTDPYKAPNVCDFKNIYHFCGTELVTL